MLINVESGSIFNRKRHPSDREVDLLNAVLTQKFCRKNNEKGVLNQVQNNQNLTGLGSMDLLFPSIDLSVCFGRLGSRGSI